VTALALAMMAVFLSYYTIMERRVLRREQR
jgi:hypothetical protein